MKASMCVQGLLHTLSILIAAAASLLKPGGTVQAASLTLAVARSAPLKRLYPRAARITH